MNAVTAFDLGQAPDLYAAAGLTVTPAGPVLGAEMPSGIDLSRPLEPAQVAAIRAASLRSNTRSSSSATRTSATRRTSPSAAISATWRATLSCRPCQGTR